VCHLVVEKASDIALRFESSHAAEWWLRIKLFQVEWKMIILER
jgi:hypothetical protein